MLKEKACYENTHGIIIGGSRDGLIELREDCLKNGFSVRVAIPGSENYLISQYKSYERPDGTKFYLYCGDVTFLPVIE